MKFENVKVRDELLIKKRVRCGLSISKEFFIPIKVERLTKTQLIVTGGRRFKKENGIEISGDSWGQSIFFPGDKENWYSKTGAEDQTKEMIEFKNKINIWIESKKIICGLSLHDDNPNLIEINELLKKVKELCDCQPE